MREECEEGAERRIEHVQALARSVKAEVLQGVEEFGQNLKRHKKYASYEDVLAVRLDMASNCIKEVANTFFDMVSDEEYIVLTPLQNFNELFDKFTKNVSNSLMKVTQNLEAEPLALETSPDRQSENESFEIEPPQSRKKSKNFKISIEASELMNDWLLRNFESPYPTTEEKRQMAQQGKISMKKVNNWFINARERTVKNYFNGKERK